MTTTASASMGTSNTGSPMTRRSASRRMAGACFAGSMATTRRRSRRRWHAACEHDRPDAGLLQDHHRQGKPQQGRVRTTCTAPPWARPRSRRLALPSAGHAAPFVVPEEIRAAWDARTDRRPAAGRLAAPLCGLRHSVSGPCGGIRTARGVPPAAPRLAAGEQRSARRLWWQRAPASPRARPRRTPSRRLHRAAARAAGRLGRPERLESHRSQRPASRFDAAAGATTSTMGCANSA